MTTDINAILDRLSYVHACYSDPDCLVFEMMKLSPESIDCLFPTEKQPMYMYMEFLKDSLILCLLLASSHLVKAHLVESIFCNSCCMKRIMILIQYLLNGCMKYC